MIHRDGWAAVSRPHAVDAGLVVLAVVITALTLRGPAYVSAGLAVAAPALLVRRSRPALVAAITMGADLAAMSALVAAGAAAPLLVGAAATIALYSLGRHGERVWLTGTALTVGYVTIVMMVNPVNPVGNVMQILAAVLLGRLLLSRHWLLERRKRRAAETAVSAERRRIARELHDVVAHHITVINVLVGAGRTTMASDRAAAEEAFVTAERTARQAMAEMRQLLHVLRADDTAEPMDHTGIGVAGVPALVEQARLPAELDVTGEAVPLPAAVDHAVYRIVQEALTNVRRHAPAARARVRLSYLPSSVEVEVTDDGTGTPVRSRGGFGLRGMAERVALIDGVLTTGPRPEGGFRVHARLPLAMRERRPEDDHSAARG
ncbi:sensor histidine kinase [Microbispora rosea]|uniref:sensor histidine kinase n=1 Tax=Microbispora rosea TaxID=58117 RepID=UPI0037B1ADB2